MGHIFLDRQNRQAAIATLRDYQHHMHPGDSILFFPEGTRSRDGHMHEFRKGAFVMARDLNLPILPISLIGTDTVLPNQTMNLFPGRMTMIIHPPVAADVVARTRSEDLLQLCRDTIAAPLPTRNKPLQETTA